MIDRRENLRTEIASLVAGILEVETAPGLSMDACAEWDSLRHLEILAAIERRFGIQIQFEDAIRMVSIEAILQMLDQKHFINQRP
jgi:acyl carrier protein